MLARVGVLNTSDLRAGYRYVKLIGNLQCRQRARCGKRINCLGGAPSLAISPLLGRGLHSPLTFCDTKGQPSHRFNDASLFAGVVERTLERVERKSKFSPVPLSLFSKSKVGYEGSTRKGGIGWKGQAKFYLSFLSQEVHSLCRCGSGKKYKNCCHSR
jgi:hypothetical protein